MRLAGIARIDAAGVWPSGAMGSSLIGAAGAWLLACALAACPPASLAAGMNDAPGAPRLSTLETQLDEIANTSALKIDDTMAVFAFVLGSLPERVTVYPTENYFYFSFHHGGTRYAGNLRLDRADRDEGKVHFAYFQDATLWAASGKLHYELLGLEQGVRVERSGRLLYRISFNGKTVTFALNDLSAVKPPSAALGTDDTCLGPVFDESGMRFFLLYNRRMRVFIYVLDETVPAADELMPSEISARIVIGRRTGFAYYLDDRLERKILVGVHADNIRVNNYLDGPFDQLPDNFIDGEELREAIVDADPGVKGKIDRLGHYADGQGRYVIAPYKDYVRQRDLLPVHRCAAEMTGADDPYYRCFDVARNAYFDNSASAAPARQRSSRKFTKRRAAGHGR